jgi:predicted RNA-binding Zn-ribbon protein involved in translation (DUF1610 family)
MRQELGGVVLWFTGVWIALGITGVVLFFISKNYRFKKRWFKPYVALVGTLFTAFLYLTGFPVKVFVFVLPALLIISWLNIRNTAFCPSCGRTIINHNWFSSIRFCASCGADLKAEEAGN